MAETADTLKADYPLAAIAVWRHRSIKPKPASARGSSSTIASDFIRPSACVRPSQKPYFKVAHKMETGRIRNLIYQRFKITEKCLKIGLSERFKYREEPVFRGQSPKAFDRSSSAYPLVCQATDPSGCGYPLGAPVTLLPSQALLTGCACTGFHKSRHSNAGI